MTISLLCSDLIQILIQNFFFLSQVAAEVGSSSLRAKTLSLGIALKYILSLFIGSLNFEFNNNYYTQYSVVSAFIVSFCVPYILDDIGANIGWAFGTIAFLCSVLVYFVLPETKVGSSSFFLSFCLVYLYWKPS